MSVLTDLFLSLSNKIRSKLGTTTKYSPTAVIETGIDAVYSAGVSAGISATKVGTAGIGDVVSGKTFTNASDVGLTGTFASQTKTQAPSTSAIDVTPDSGKWLSKVTVSAIQTETKTQAPSTSAIDVTPTSGKFLTKVTVSAIPTETKSASPSTSAQTITPTSGKFLTSVSISAISPQRTAGTAAVASGQDSTGPYVYFPYGWWPSGGNDRQYCRMTAAQAVAACPSQEKTVTSSRSAQTVSPDSGKLLSKVTVNALAPTGTYTASSRGASLDMGATSNYRYVNTNGVPNSNSGTYTPSGHGTALDMGATNTYRYVNTTNAYNDGVKSITYFYMLCQGTADSLCASRLPSIYINKGIQITNIIYTNTSYTNGDEISVVTNTWQSSVTLPLSSDSIGKILKTSSYNTYVTLSLANTGGWRKVEIEATVLY